MILPREEMDPSSLSELNGVVYLGTVFYLKKKQQNFLLSMQVSATI